jgi:hypothetical protein
MSGQGFLFPIGIGSPLFDEAVGSRRSTGTTTAKSGGNFPPRTFALAPLTEKEFGARWAQFLKFHYKGANADKAIARDFNCAPRTARDWKNGQAPRGPEALRTAGDLYGEAAVMRLLFPEYKEATTAALQQQLDGLMAQLNALRQGIAEGSKPCMGDSSSSK